MDKTDFTIFLFETGEFFGSILNEKEQNMFLNKIVEEIPWFFKSIVGNMDDSRFGKGISEYGFDMKNMDSTTVSFTNGYLSPNSISESIESDWFKCVKTGNSRGIKEFLALGMNPNKYDSDKQPLIYSLASNHPKLLEQFIEPLSLEFEADVDVNIGGSCTIHVLAEKHPEYLEKLFLSMKRSGADLSAKNVVGNTFIHIIACLHPERIESLFEFLEKNDSAILDEIKRMKNMYGENFVHILAEQHFEVFERLAATDFFLEHGISLNETDGYGRHILHIIASYHPEQLKNFILSYAEKYNLDVRAKDGKKRTIPRLIAEYASDAFVNTVPWFVKEYGFDLRDKCEDEYTLLSCHMREDVSYIRKDLIECAMAYIIDAYERECGERRGMKAIAEYVEYDKELYDILDDDSEKMNLWSSCEQKISSIIRSRDTLSSPSISNEENNDSVFER